MRYLHPAQRLRRDQTGATAIEFAVVSFAFFMMMFATIEYGLIMMTKVAIESAVQQSGRGASIGQIVPGCSDRVCSVQRLVQQKTLGLISPGSVIVTATVVSNPITSTPPVPDICLDDSNDPYPAICTIRWQDNNGNGAYDPPSPAPVSIGNPGDLIEIRVTYLWRVLFPMFRSYFGPNGALTISSSTVVKNEPF